MNDSINFNPDRVLRGQRTNSLCVADKFVTQPPELSACQGHKSSTEAEISCESAAWGRAAWALRHPPTLPESAVSVATRAGGGAGGGCDARWKWRDKHLRVRMDAWMMDDGDTERCVMKGCGRVSGELELIPQHFTQWQIDGQKRTTATTEGISFHSQWQRRSRSRLRGLNQPLTMSLCETSFSHMVLF